MGDLLKSKTDLKGFFAARQVGLAGQATTAIKGVGA